MSLHSTVFPPELAAAKATLEHVPIEQADKTQTGGVHLGPGHHEKDAAERHEMRLQEQAAGSSQSYCDFAAWNVNPDVVKSNAATLAKVSFRGKEIALGQILTRLETQTAPTLDWAPASINTVAGTPQLYTVFCVDPDAPSREDPKMRCWLHWAVVNVTGPQSIESGYTIVPYMGPAPPPNAGLHRYCFLVYAQKSVIESSSLKTLSDDQRPKFCVDTWIGQHKFIFGADAAAAVPIAGNMFRCQHEHQAAQSAESAKPTHDVPASKK